MNLRRCVAFMAVLAASHTAAEARAEESAYCRKVHARAASDASLLFAPSVTAQAIRFPQTGFLGAGATTGEGYQARASLSVDPLDMYKGTRVLRVGDADCAHHEAQIAAEEVLASGVDAARLPALRREAALLGEARPRWEAIVRTEQARLDAHVANLLETNEIQARATELERRSVQVSGEIAALEAKGVVAPTAPTGALVNAERASAMQLEREASHIRSLDPWHVTATGGVIPQTSPVDYYAIIQVQLNFGAFARNAAETRYLEAREAELRQARYELPDQLRRYRAAIHAASVSANRELEILERQAAAIATAESALAESEAPNAPHARAVLGLDAIVVETERAFLRAYISELSRLESNHASH